MKPKSDESKVMDHVQEEQEHAEKIAREQLEKSKHDNDLGKEGGEE